MESNQEHGIRIAIDVRSLDNAKMCVFEILMFCSVVVPSPIV